MTAVRLRFDEDMSKEEFERRIDEIRAWLDDVVGLGGLYDPIMASNYRWMASLETRTPVTLFTFKDPRMATMFKLTWG